MLVRSTERGVSTTEEQRQDIDELIAALEPCEPRGGISVHLICLPSSICLCVRPYVTKKGAWVYPILLLYYITRIISCHVTLHHFASQNLRVHGAVNPNAKSVTSESLSALWILEWTTEREILFLMETGLPWKPSGPVQQEIDVDAKTLSNRMIFGDDSLFEVFSSIDPEVGAPRCSFIVCGRQGYSG